MTAAQLSVAFFLQMFVILAVARVVGHLARRIGQPQVVGEMIAGVLIGPSLFGLIFPESQLWLFPEESLKTLKALAEKPTPLTDADLATVVQVTNDVMVLL